MARLKEAKVEITRYNYLPSVLKLFFAIAAVSVFGLGFFYVFSIMVHGRMLFTYSYYWLFIALICSCGFLILPARKKDRTVLPWYDITAAILVFSICIYFYSKSWLILIEAWNSPPLGIILGLLVLELGRRRAGPIFCAICAIALIYPFFAGHMPGMLWGRSMVLNEAARVFFFSHQGMLGTMTKVAAEILVGFLLFAGFLIGSGAADFFLKFATALMGRHRGGPAKVAVLASGFFASLSGSATTNVVATGSFTIPAMKRTGYSPEYAGAIEACASTGGPLMPPVMGAVVFIMCELTNIPYGTIIVAAAIPAILYYYGMFIQVDTYAARVGLKGLPEEEMPSLKKTLKEGWPFIFVLLFLIWGLVYMRWGRLAPWYATGIIVLLSFTSRKTMLTPKKFLDALVGAGQLIVQIGIILLCMSFIVCGFVVTGASGSFTSGLVSLGGGNLALVIVVGIIVAYIFGMAGMIVPAYIFLAIALAPALLRLGNLNLLAVHLFIIYYAELAFITPPVATAAFMGAAIAEASFMRTAFRSMRLGVVLFFIPLFFLFEPALILQEHPLRLLYLFPLCLVGIFFIAEGIEGYLLKLGKLKWWMRPPLIVAGFLIAFPEWKATVIGFIVAAATIAIIWSRKKLIPEKSL